MAGRLAEVQIHAAVSTDSLLSDESSEDVPVSVDLVDERLYLGNLTAACDLKTLQKLKITHILTIDSVPLPRAVLDKTSLNLKYVKLADVPKEDMITHLPETNEFIKEGLAAGGTILVHCYFGVSRSAAVVIAYIMTKYGLCYEDAFKMVKSKRRFIGPNVGFVAQLKLFGHMGYKINKDDPRFRQFRLKMAGQQLKEDLVKPDPGLIQERPDPVVYRCKKCRRIVASQRNLIPHIPKQLKIELAKKGIRPPPCNSDMSYVQNEQMLLDKLKSLTCQTTEQNLSDVARSCEELILDDTQNEYEGSNVDLSIASRSDCPEVCKLVYFIEPMCWMKDVQHQMQGKLHCPKCTSKIGSFSWVMGCKCPCGQKVAPAFYLVPSKVEWSNVVQNVQITV